MKFLNKYLGLLFLLLSLSNINSASAASLHGHRHRHSEENAPKVVHEHVTENAISPSPSLAPTEMVKVQQRHRHPPSRSHGPRDPSRVEYRGGPDREELRGTALWMQRSVAMLIVGLIMGADMVD
jgi:hypothetical protein